MPLCEALEPPSQDIPMAFRVGRERAVVFKACPPVVGAVIARHIVGEEMQQQREPLDLRRRQGDADGLGWKVSHQGAPLRLFSNPASRRNAAANGHGKWAANNTTHPYLGGSGAGRRSWCPLCVEIVR